MTKKEFLRKYIDRFSFIARGRLITRGVSKRKIFSDVNQLVEDHFANNTIYDHPCRNTLSLALNYLNQKQAIIIETGSSAWGSNSSLLFDSYVNSFGGEFHSVDIRIEPLITLRQICSERTTFYCNDSLVFLQNYKNSNVDLVYLDSFDIKWNDPIPSMLHGFYEFLLIYPLLRSKVGSLLLIDDTPLDDKILEKVQPDHITAFLKFKSVYGINPGKGSLVKEFLRHNKIGFEIKHEYQLLWKF